MTQKTAKSGLIDELFSVGAHFGFVKSRRHPSAKRFIFGTKNKIEIFDLEKTSVELESAINFVEEKGREAAPILFVGGKSEARAATQAVGERLDMPYVASRWIGGSLTNFSEIKKRLARMEELEGQRERGELGKYTKKERLLIDREIERLNDYFGGLRGLKGIPKLMIIVDPREEHNALAEARRLNIPTVALAGSDSNLASVTYAIPGNDASRQTITFVLNKLAEAYEKGLATRAKEKSEEPKEVKAA